VLYTFDASIPDGIDPVAIIQGADGNIYGVTQYGGANGNCGTCIGPSGDGTFFKVTPAGVETVLYSFGASSTDGVHPVAVIQGADGDFYGVTGGNYGTFFKITPAGVETVLYSFGASSTDGNNPAGVIQGADGNFYGTTTDGGANGEGTVFKITPAGVETVLYSFGASSSDGAYPSAGVIQGTDGNFYGATTYGGIAYGAGDPPAVDRGGVVFKVTPAGLETILYSFSFAPASMDGYRPPTGVIQGSDGHFYGVTTYGGPTQSGIVYQITPAGVETVLFTFPNRDNGSNPQFGIIQGMDGYFYGTAGDVVYKLTPAGDETVLYRFAPNTNPGSPVIQGTDGNLYGIAFGGALNVSVIYKITL
jgi:uncharacterized repeat protein (TIGR03803 family)